MSSSKPVSRYGSTKKDGSSRSGSKALALVKGKNSNSTKSGSKSCDCLLKSDCWKTSRLSPNSKAPAKKMGKSMTKDGKKGASDHHEKVVIVSKRSSSVSVVKSCNLRKSVSVRKVSYSTSFVVSSDEDSDSEEEDDDDESDYEEKSTSRKKTVIKRTTSKVKSNFSNKKSDRAAKKAKAIKLLCDKLSNKKANERELRPRFPYSMLQEWPAERTHRMASLNALAKVHVLYENESRAGENLKDADESSLIDFLNEENSDEDSDQMEVRSCSEKKNEKLKCTENIKRKSKPVKRMKKRKASDVEIIDTRLCKRMASLNAQAILAASYVPEPKPKKALNKKTEKQNQSCDLDLKVFMESKCDLEIIETNKKLKSSKTDSSSMSSSDIKLNKIPPPDMHLSDSKNSDSTDIVGVMSPDPLLHSWRLDSDMPFGKNCQKEKPSDSTNIISSSASTKMGVTQYSEVTKVKINSLSDREVKEESSPSRKIERFLGNDDVAITQMYHYQSKNSNESYCVQMKTTYKPGSRNLSPAIPMSPPNSIHPHMGDPLFHGRPNYYGHSPMLPAPPYHMNPAVAGIHPVMGLDHHIPHQYGASAFSMPHYRHPTPMQYHPGEYGYYQPAGPLIQHHHEQYIHKPVPYHPQPHLHQPPQRPQNPHRDSYGSFDSFRTHPKSPLVQTHHIHKPSSLKPLPSTIPETSRSALMPTSSNPIPYQHHTERSPHERSMGMNPVPYNLSPKAISPSSLQSPYHPHTSYREYLKQKSLASVGSYSKSYDSMSSSFCNTYHSALPGDQHYHQTKTIHPLSYESKDNRPLETFSAGQPPTKMNSSSFPGSSMDGHSSYNVTDIKEPGWSIKTSPDESPGTPVSFMPYSIETRKELYPVNSLPESPKYPVRPPSVIEIEEESSRDTKTYIQLEVPRNNYREKIVVIDVEKEVLNKEKRVQNLCTQNETDLPKAEEDKKEDILPNKTEDDASVPEENKAVAETEAVDQSKESPDVMVLEVKKKKESAVVRRARLHGKQRTFRDSYNRPLVPLSKVKKTDCPVVDSSAEEVGTVEVSTVAPLPPPKSAEKKFAHGWSWEGKPFQKQVYVSNDESPCVRYCYPAIKHLQGDVICVRDCVLLRSGPRKTDLPFVAKITALWDNPVDGEMTMSLMWYYRPEHTETGKKLHYIEDEIFASKHKDTNSVACIEDKCYVLTYSEYCRFRKRCKMVDDSAIPNPSIIVPVIEVYPRNTRLPPFNVSPDLVFFCRKVYDFRQKRLLKNPV